MSEDASLFMHHDSVTGTAKRYVDDDYMKRMGVLEEKARLVVKNSYQADLFHVNEYQFLQGLKDAPFKKEASMNLALYNQGVQVTENYSKFTYYAQPDKDLVLTDKSGHKIKAHQETCL